MFQFALPRGERRHRAPRQWQPASFNSRSRVGSDRRRPRCRRCMGSFNSRSRVGSDYLAACAADLMLVSIRAPAWGATSLFAAQTRLSHRFNSRSRVGSDATTHYDDARYIRVSIRAPAWGATGCHFLRCRLCWVSIRAPAWGATYYHASRPYAHIRFQFALPRGERHVLRLCVHHALLFQFALPRGERRQSYVPLCKVGLSFNSRSRVGSDQSPPSG